jgi:hypothetical protein
MNKVYVQNDETCAEFGVIHPSMGLEPGFAGCPLVTRLQIGSAIDDKVEIHFHGQILKLNIYLFLNRRSTFFIFTCTTRTLASLRTGRLGGTLTRRHQGLPTVIPSAAATVSRLRDGGGRPHLQRG